MEKLIREIRLATFVGIINIALFVLPKDCIKTLNWILKMPFED
jgi:hypothetical protein